MKNLLFLLFLANSLFLNAQEGEDHPMPDPGLLESFPWFGDNQYLLDYIAQRGYYDNAWGLAGSNLRTNCNAARYRIPIKMHIYLDDNGTYKKRDPETSSG